MMCDFVARTNWSNIKSNYFVDTIIIFNLFYYTNITVTVTFVNQATLCRAFFFSPPKYYSHKSCTIFHIDLYMFNTQTETSNGTNVLYYVKRLAVFQNKPFWIPYSRMNHLCHHWNKQMLTIVQNTFTAVVLDGFLSSMKGSSLMNRLPFPSFFFDLVWQTERICPSKGSIGRIWSRFEVGVRSFVWNWSVRNGGVLGESSTYFREASQRFSTGQEWDWHAPDACWQVTARDMLRSLVFHSLLWFIPHFPLTLD